MKFQSKTPTEKAKLVREKRAAKLRFTEWFAWYPVTNYFTGEIFFFETIWRKRTSNTIGRDVDWDWHFTRDPDSYVTLPCKELYK